MVVLLAASLAWPAVPAAPPAAGAVGAIKAVFVDVVDPGGTQVVQTYRDTDVAVMWDHATGELIAEGRTDGTTDWRIRMGPRHGDQLVAGPYDAPGGSPTAAEAGLTAERMGSGAFICAGGTFTVTEIDPNPVKDTPATIVTVAISFTQSCAGKTVNGEIRWLSSWDVSAVGYAADPHAGYELTVPRAETFAGNYSALTSILLENHGTQVLTFGTLALVGEAVDRWYVGVDECSDKSIAPGEICELGLRAIEWIPNAYDDFLTLPVSTASGALHIRLPSLISAASFVPIEPVRLLDTRSGIAISGRLQHKAARTLTVVNRTPTDPARNIPTTAVAIVGNLTITGQTTAGHATLTTFLQNNPTTSTLNVPRGDTRANGTIVRLAGDIVGITWVGLPGSATHAVFDATGYFIPTEESAGVRAGNFRPANPYRVVDTRSGQGISSALRPNQPRNFTVPLVGVDINSTAVTGNLTVVNPTGAGHVTIAPVADATPTTSTINFPRGDTRANNVVVKLSPTKKLSVTYVGPPNTSVHIVFDVTGTFGSGNIGYVPLVPNRIVDSRIGLGFAGRIQAGSAKEATVENRVPSDPSKNLPPDSSTGELLFKHAVTGNATFVGPTRAGHLTVLGAMPASQPPTSTINSPAGDTRANGVILSSCCPPTAAFWYQAASRGLTHVVFDVTGYFIQ